MPNPVRLGELRVGSRGDGFHLFDAHFGFRQVLLQRREPAAGIGQIAAQVVALVLQLARVIGEQPGLGVPDGHLDGIGTPENTRLTSQMAQLAADSAQQIVETREIVLGVRQLAQRPFLAFAVLESADGPSMNARCPLGSARRMASSPPCPTITCIYWPRPESDRSSLMSSNRHADPLIAYSEPPLRYRVRPMVTSV